jgi:hypothetical protein
MSSPIKTPLISWKGKTLNQITSILQLNKNTNNNPTNVNIYHAGPIKLYRREIATNPLNKQERGNPRTSIRIDELNRPNGYFISQTLPDCSNNGIISYIDQQDTGNTTNLYENGGTLVCPTKSTTTTINNTYLSQEFNAKRRVRSAGMIIRKYNPSCNGTTYSTSNAQYLASRSKTFEQNDYHFNTPGNPVVVYKPNNSQYAQQGGVSSSEKISRLKYDTITTVGATYRSAYGSQVANELAYGVAPTDAAYTLKSALGYPLKYTPKFDYTGKMVGKCIPTSFAHMI